MNISPVEVLVRDRIGLDPASLGAATFRRTVEGRMTAHGLTDPAAYAGLLTTEPADWAALVGELVVHETWFFRGGAGLFDHLVRWVRERAAPVRVLSVPCSTGEEPYSLAIALDAAGVPPAHYQIDGVELARDHLLRAVAGRYTAFSFREPGPDPRPRHFVPVGEDRWELRTQLRERVRFRPGNLIEPGFLAGEPPYDLILCRNLFIYLTPDARARALANLDRLLAPDGRLCLTPAEADRLPAGRFVPDGPANLSIFRRANGPDAMAPRSGVVARPTGSGVVPRSGIVPPARRDETARKSGAAPVPAARIRYEHVPLPKPAAALPPPDPQQAGRELADSGQLDAARAVCEAALVSSPSAGLFSLLGVVHLATGQRDEAADAFRKALYLDPDHAEAITHMIVLCEQRGDPGQAAALRHRLARLERGVTA